MQRLLLVQFLLVLSIIGFSQKNINTAVLPSPSQLRWHQLEYYWFAHFGPNTFTGEEWGSGQEPTSLFNPINFDARQWCQLAKKAGAKGIIITAKHHDGFCLWPSQYSTHTVRESPWKNGKGDILKELSLACKEFGLLFGVYLSPWDRNHPAYGTASYNQVFVKMLTEIFQQYGPIWELWWDGANGEGPNGKKQVYDWELFRNTVKKLSPQTVIFSDVGPDIRWVGNEKGFAGTSNWNLLNTDGFEPGEKAPSTDTLQTGNKYGKNWIPAECDVSIRPGWFWRASEDNKVKTPENLFQLYLKSVGRGANLLLNVPPNDKGVISQFDSVSLIGFNKLLNENFKSDLVNKIRTLNNGSKLTQIDLGKNSLANCIVIQEDLSNGQACSQFDISLYDESNVLLKTISGTTIGNKRIITFPELPVKKIILRILEQKKSTKISEIKVFSINESLIEKVN
ncbi:MAG: glycoside hydrolase family 29 (alpha-L-fucosidase) [Chitinophagaceae bacterium]|nr:glycoside hydrolase family 29 (alpha-L-fucosidase) [Chitinophagaceae bacterium]